MQVGALIAFLSYLIQILMSVMLATFVAVMAPRASVSAERIQEVLDAEPSIAAPATPVTELGATASLELRDVGFEYPGAEYPVLSGIDFRVRAGETTSDGKLSLLTARCLGACGIAPAVVLDGTVRGHETTESMLDQLKGWLPDGSA